MTATSNPPDLRNRVNPTRLLEIATHLIAAPSPTGDARPALDALETLLRSQRLTVQRHAASHENAPAVVVRLESNTPGPTLQFNGHLDVVHLPFTPPRVENNLLRGSGASDMKGGFAAAVEALLTLREAGYPKRGSLLLTAHDLHEAPWGNGAQLDTLIDSGIAGDAVLIPEPLSSHLPIRGRGQACFRAEFSRVGTPSHEVMHPADQGYPLFAAADLATRLATLNHQLHSEIDPVAGHSSAFVGQIHAGELYNQSPQNAWLEGTRRWIPGASATQVEHDFKSIVARVASDHRVTSKLEYRLVRDAFALDPHSSIVRAFQAAMRSQTGSELPLGPKPFVDDGNSFHARRGIPAITHGPRAGGQHTTEEWVDIADLNRVASVYVETAIRFWEETNVP